MILALTLSRGSFAVLSRKQPARSPKLWILVEATAQEENRTVDQKYPPRTTQKGRSGSQLSANDIRHGSNDRWARKTNPSGYLNARYHRTRWWYHARKTCWRRYRHA